VSAPVDRGRRRFIQISLTAAGALLVAPRLRAAPQPNVPPELLGDDLTAVGPFVRIERDNRIVIGAPACEVGQGVFTDLPMLVAEELDVDWSQVRVVQLPYGYADGDGDGAASVYGAQGIDAASAAAQTHLREAGASARWLLVQAAAQEWKLPAEQLRTQAGEVLAPDGRKLSYGALARSAAAIAPPDKSPPLKKPDAYAIVGKPVRTADARAIVTGHRLYGIDAYAANALVTVIARCPFPGGTLATFDDAKARRVAGVVDVIELPKNAAAALPAGVAVLAEHTWAALQGRDALVVEWKPADADAEPESSAALVGRAHTALDSGDGAIVVRSDGDAAKLRKQPARHRLEARYELPFLAHAMLEPPGALVDIRQDGARLVAPLQDPDGASRLVAKLTGLQRKDITIEMPRGGGSFGRRLDNDYVAEAVVVAKAAGKPVKLMWTREDDLRHDRYRPFGVHALAASLDAHNRISAWSHRCAATPLDAKTPNAGLLEAAAFPAGHVAHLEQAFFALPTRLPLAAGAWLDAFRAFAVESFIDELAIVSRQDAVKLRLAMLEDAHAPARTGGFDTARLAHALRECAARIDWTTPRTNGHGLGIACHAVAGGCFAHAFEVSVEGRQLLIHRAVCVADIGRVVNPLNAEAQVAGATLDGVSAALYQAITLKDGRIQQHGFQDYPLLRIGASPRATQVQIIDSNADPIDPALACASAAPALANAVYAATTVRVRKLPLMAELMRML